jgi:hypothetical protein
MGILKELFNLPLKDLFGLSVLGVILSSFGALVGIVIKDFLFVRSFENWKSKQSLVSVYRRYRDPILLSSIELLNRIREIIYQAPVNYLSSDFIDCKVQKMTKNSSDDPYYLKYKLVSTIYRLCSFLGWIELYRQEVTFLDSGKNKDNKNIEKCIDKIRGDIADGHLNMADDWESWTDSLLFREEQRAIGEAMIITSEGDKKLIGYGVFNQYLLCQPGDLKKHWFEVASNFILDLNVEDQNKDFRHIRCLRLINHLIDLIEILDKNRLTPDYKILRAQVKMELKGYAVTDDL